MVLEFRVSELKWFLPQLLAPVQHELVSYSKLKDWRN